MIENTIILQYNLPRVQYTFSSDAPIHVSYPWRDFPEGIENTSLQLQWLLHSMRNAFRAEFFWGVGTAGSQKEPNLVNRLDFQASLNCSTLQRFSPSSKRFSEQAHCPDEGWYSTSAKMQEKTLEFLHLAGLEGCNIILVLLFY